MRHRSPWCPQVTRQPRPTASEPHHESSCGNLWDKLADLARPFMPTSLHNIQCRRSFQDPKVRSVRLARTERAETMGPTKPQSKTGRVHRALHTGGKVCSARKRGRGVGPSPANGQAAGYRAPSTRIPSTCSGPQDCADNTKNHTLVSALHMKRGRRGCHIQPFKNGP